MLDDCYVKRNGFPSEIIDFMEKLWLLLLLMVQLEVFNLNLSLNPSFIQSIIVGLCGFNVPC